MMIGGGEQIEVMNAPAVAEVRRAIYARPFLLMDQPIAVDPQLWRLAQEQLRTMLQARGWNLLGDPKCNRQNFLLCGVPVVMTDG